MAWSEAQSKKWRKWLGAELVRAEVARHKKTLQRLDEEAKAAREKRKADLIAQHKKCATDYQATKEAADEAYKKARQLALEVKRQKKGASRIRCRIAKDGIREEAKAKIEATLKQRKEEQRFKAEMDRLSKSAQARGRRGISAKERKSESDDEVRSNLPEYLHPLWEQVKRSIKPSDRRSRTESMLHYAEENPQDVLAAQQANERKQDREMAEEEARHFGAERPTRKKRPQPTKGPQQTLARKQGARLIVDDEEPIPF